MADAKKTIELVFEGVDKTGAATQAALKNVQGFSSSVQSATQPMADFTVGALKFEAALIASGVAATAFAVKIAGDFDTAFREISTLIQAPVDDLDEFKNAILSYAQTSTKPLEEINQSIYNAISAGIDFADSIDAVTLAEKLSVAGKATLNDSLVVLVSSLNAYGVGMEKAEEFSDLLFQTVKSGQTTLPELAGSLASVTGLAATAGVGFDELLAAIATLTSTGTPTAQAVTQIQGAISAILKPSSQATTLAKELGIQFDAQRLKAVGLNGILNDVALATGGNTTEMARLFGRVEALNGVLTLTGLGADKFALNLEAMRNSAGAVDAAFAIMVQSVDASAQKIQNALTGLFIAIGAPLLDEFGGVAEAIAGIFNALGDSANTGKISELVAYIEAEFGGLRDTLAIIARNLPDALDQADFSGFTNGLEAVTGAVGELFSDIDLTTVEGLADAITLVGSGFEALSGFTGGVISSFKPLFDKITEVAGGLTDLDSGFFKSAGEMAGFATQANVISGAIAGMIPAIQGLVAIIGINQTSGLVGSLISASTSTNLLIKALGSGGLLAAAGGAGYAIGTLLADQVDDLVQAYISSDDTLGTWIAGMVKAGDEAESMAEILKPTVGGIREIGDEAADATGSLHDLSFEFGKLDDTIGTITELEPLDNLAPALSKAATAVKELSSASEDLHLEEKLALIEAKTATTIAALDADAKKTVAAFESISVSVQSTGEAITDLFGLLGDDNISKLDKLDISEQIELENERRQEALDLQKKLTQEEIALARAKRIALISGQALITIDGAGLQPHLEAFMWEILQSIQTRVNADGYEMLLGP